MKRTRAYKGLNALVLLVLTSLVMPALAQTAEEKGLQIAQERKSRDEGWGDSQAEASMILRTADRQEIERKMRLLSLEMENDGDKGLTIFDQPADVKGTAFLNYSHAIEPDEQWMYLPALKRVKRIASRSKSGPFMGSEFAFEDLSSFEVEKYQYRYLRDEKLSGMDTFVVEQTPAYEHSGYTKLLVWIDKQHYRAHKIEFYDRKDSLLKTLTMHDYQQYLDKYWRPMKLSMVNHQTGKSTDLITHALSFRTGLTEDDFSQASLKRAR
ncbi:outer membrane lipoprotein-sorting protein [Bowmanella dokdonensis]|uniref:Outer membrane lipoprotein-sorting protein n=1 Tax=Bowmanella dokdonensis TaxID=751969 RepID=A0A939IRL9_9ALTE|nr:outer membrane lipoprotein-sorting protein [Bowmanella dokdonensis]MBN7826229.1 outer membrane lipoprotein-sorting protein [Bowmanella dokdonensis]